MSFYTTGLRYRGGYSSIPAETEAIELEEVAVESAAEGTALLGETAAGVAGAAEAGTGPILGAAIAGAVGTHANILYHYSKPIANVLSGRGLTVPGYKYLGPGNKLNKGNPTSNIDADALEHDIAYSKANQSSDVAHADNKFIAQANDHIVDNINSNPNYKELLGGAIGSIGIGIKQQLEKHTGLLYPNISKYVWFIKTG